MNGPASCTGEEPVWERPWSLEEIRKSSHSWSLGADAGLLNFLKEFSQQTISRTHEIEKQLDGLVREVKSTDCRLHNVFNDFLMLSNTQFIENRVYDEEIEEHIVKPEQGDKPEQEKTREQKEAELIPKIQEAVNFGLQVLETAFEQLDIKAGNSDSEDEEVNERVDPILEPKDLYIDRPLPYLIGSQLFMQQEDVGLGDLSSEEGSVDNDRGSVIDSEEEEEEEEEEKDNEEDSDEDFGNNSEEERKLRTALSDEDEDNGSDLFGESDKEEEEENDKSAKTRTKSFADELAARIQAEIPKRLEADDSSISSSEVKTKKEKEKKEVKRLPSDDEDDDMFKPPKLTDEDFFGNKGGLFSGGKGLFDDDDDEEGDLFSDLHTTQHNPSEPAPVVRPETLPSDVKKKLPYGGVSLFPGGENAINSSILADKDKRKPPTPTDVAAKPVTSTSLFDDVMFGGSAAAQPAAKAKPAADLFADDDDLFNDRPSMPPAAITKNKVAADLDKKNIQLPTEKPQPPQPTSKKRLKGLFSDEEDSESDLFLPSQTASKPKAATSAAPATKTSKSLSLFDDEDEDFFVAAPESKPMPAPNKPAQQPALPVVPSKTQKPTLFSSDEEEPVKVSNDIKPVENNKTEPPVPPKSGSQEEKREKKSSLFDDNEEDDLFAITKDSQKKHHRVSLLFEEDENSEEPLFSSAGSTAKSTGHTLEQSKTTAPVKVDTEKVSLFDDVKRKPESKAPVTVEDTAPPAVQKDNTVKSVTVKEPDDLFADTPPTLKHARTKTTNVLSLFGDEDDEKENQLSTSAAPKDSGMDSTEKSTQAKSTRVFQDEELLFSQELQKDNDPDVDLFASTSKKATEKPSAGKPSDGLGLFGDEDEDDLFSAKPKKPPKPAIKKESLGPPKEPNNMNVEKEPILKAEGGEKPTRPAPVKSKSPSSRIGKLQANMHINPAALLPGAVPKLSGARHAVPETKISSSPSAESSRSSDVGAKSMEGVSFETPAQVDTLHSANKSRAKVGGKRRPPTRISRKRASQDSGDAGDLSDSSPISPRQETSSEAALAQSNWQPDKGEPIPSMKLSFSENDVQSRTKPKAPVNPLTPDVNDLFGSDLFGNSSLPDPVTSRQKEKLPVPEASSHLREEGNKSSASVFDADGSDDDLFKSVKEKHKKTFKPTSQLDDKPDEDLFGAHKSQKKVDVQPVAPKDIKATTDIFEDDIFAAEAIKPVKKPKEKKTTSEANLFDDNSDIFADLTHKPKEKKSKKKAEAKSIFDDDMDDIFSSSVSSTKKSKPKAKSTPPTSETKEDTKVSNMFDDPLNVFGK